MSIDGLHTMESVSSASAINKPQIDAMSKNIENKISAIQRQRQQVSKEDISADDKMKKRQELQQEISRLNAQLRQHQAEERREKNKETVEKEFGARTDKADTGDTKKTSNPEADKTVNDNKEKKIINSEKNQKVFLQENSIATSGYAVEQLQLQHSVMTGIKNDMRIIKGEIRQDGARGEKVDDKEKQLAKGRSRLQRISASEYAKASHRSSKKASTAGTNYSKAASHVERQNFNISFNNK